MASKSLWNWTRVSAAMMAIAGVIGLSHCRVAFAEPCAASDEYDEIVSVVTKNFFDQSFNGLDWAFRTSEYRRRLTCDDSAERVATVVNGLLAELRASHTALYTRTDQQYWGLNSFFSRAAGTKDAFQIDYSGIWAEEHDGQWFARFVMQGSQAARAGIVVGDALIAINGSKFAPLKFPPGESALTVSSDGRATRDVRIATVRQSIMLGLEHASRASTRILTADRKRAGYFHLWAGGEAIRQLMEQALKGFESEHVDTLIMDLRGGYGGMGEDQLDRLRRSETLSAIPKYFLIDDSVRSGKELVAGVIRRDRLGVLVGSRTAGQYLGGRPFTLADGKYLLYVAIGGSRPPREIPGIGPIEGEGIDPHVVVAPCWRYCDGHDPILEKALELSAG